jgi:hypothetical protein
MIEISSRDEQSILKNLQEFKLEINYHHQKKPRKAMVYDGGLHIYL